MSDEARKLELLEERFAHAQRMMDEMSEELRRQGMEVDRLKLELMRQRERLEALEEPPEATRPPHY